MERLPPGGVVGRYELVARLGEGAMGIVYLGRSRGGDLVAVKVMKDLWVADPDYRARFRREIGAARRVTGLYTAAPLDFDADASPPWLATRYLPGLSLRDAVRRHGAGLPPPALRALATGLAEALSAIHAAGVVHRDLKPENVLLTADGPRVIDFGIARPDDATFLTVPGGSRFTREYSAPEQAAGGPVDAAGDVFALGAVVLFAAGARDPFGSGPPRSAPDLSAVTDPALRRVVGACLRWEPRRRPSARQVLDRLGTGTPPLAGSRWLPDGVADEIDRRASYALDLPSLPSLPTPGATPASALGAETLPPPPVLPVPAVRPGPRRRTLVVGAAGLGVLAVAGTVVGTRWRRGTAAPGAGPAASRSAAPSPTAPPVATERWHVRAATTYPELDLAAGLVLAWSDARLMGLDPATGHTRWSRSARLGGAGVAKGSGGTPLRGGTAAGFAYLLDNTSFPWALSAVRASSGAVAWRQALDTYPLTPLVRTGDVLCFGVDGAVRAIGSDGGAARWSVSVDATGGLAAGGGVLVAAGEHALCGLSAATGRQLWRYALASGATPVVADGLAIASDTHGTLHAVRAADGAAVWRRAIHAAGPTPYAAGVLYATTDPGTVYALRTATGATVWTRRLGNPTNESYGYPSVLGHSDGTLHVGGNDRIVYALDAATGRPRWTYPAAVSLTTAPVTATGLVFIGTRDGYARALVPPNGGDRAGA